jgi:hypothetical protein
MKKYSPIVFAVAAASVIALTQPSWAQKNWTGNLNLAGGFKSLQNEWKPGEDQTAFGIQSDIRLDTWPISVIADYAYAKSGAESVAIPSGGSVAKESRTDELALGVRKYFERNSAWRPFMGGGVSLLRGELETTGPVRRQSDSDTAVGLWAGVGTVFTWYETLNTGVQAKYSTGDVDIDGASLDAGGILFGVLVGFNW